MDGNSNNFDSTFPEAEAGTEEKNEKPEQERSDDSNAAPLAEKPECSENIQPSDGTEDNGIPGTDTARNEKSNTDHIPKKDQLQVGEAQADSNDQPTSPLSTEDALAINTLASF